MKAYTVAGDGIAQLHLEPESDFDKVMLKHFAALPGDVVVQENVSFVETRGEYIRRSCGGEGLTLVRRQNIL
jgi:hypothetical protein